MEKIRRKKVTMEDVAKIAGTSVSTVAHVINHTAHITPERAALVEQAIKELGYKPRAKASLNKGQRTIGVFTPEISNEFYARAIQSIFTEAWEHDYAVMVCSMQHHHKAEASYIRSLIQSGVCGMIFFGGASADERQVIDAAKRVPVVLGDHKLPNANVDCVGTDNEITLRRTIAKLAKAGYKRIGFVCEDLIMSNSQERYNGFKKGMKENGLSIDEDWVLLRQELRLSKLENAYIIFNEILKKQEILPEAFICTSDLIAIGVMAALKQNGYRIPRDVGIVGFDDISIAAYTDPPLTTIAQDMRQLGRTCFMTLLNRMEEKNLAPRDIIIRTKLTTRESIRL